MTSKMVSVRPWPKFIDIGANLLDSMYLGTYNGNQKHAPDLEQVLERSWNSNLDKIIITGTNLEESRKAINLANSHEKLYCTVGCHPTNCMELNTSPNSDVYLSEMSDLISQNRDKVVAIGEIGLDYDRLHFCAKDLQLRWFEEQLIRFAPLGLPLFLHCRNAATDLLEILTRHKSLWENKSAVVHSFDGSVKEAEDFIQLGLFIGLNGCSLKTPENLDTIRTLPRDRLIIETDSPWCEVRPAHAGSSFIQSKLPYPVVKKEKWISGAMVKGRNEPCAIIHILEIMAGVRCEDIDNLGKQVYENTCNLFFSGTQ